MGEPLEDGDASCGSGDRRDTRGGAGAPFPRPPAPRPVMKVRQCCCDVTVGRKGRRSLRNGEANIPPESACVRAISRANQTAGITPIPYHD